MSDRAGRYVTQLEGYAAFIPAPLPPQPPIEMSSELVTALSAADAAVGTLNGLAHALPDTDLFLAMFVRQEALLSSKIEGTECSMDDVLSYELLPAERPTIDVGEVVNYVAALHHGIKMLDELPLCGRVIRGMHEVLLRSGRGADKSPGEFRRTQNWIGPAGCDLAGASFVPPPHHHVVTAMAELDVFVDESDLPPLVVAGLAHAQLETIHPFLDGNGRAGRLFISLLLHYRGLLDSPVLYLSTFLRERKAQYFAHLTSIRDEGAWEAWLLFFFRGVAEAAQHAVSTARAVLRLSERARTELAERGAGANDAALLAGLFKQPLVNSAWVQAHIDVSAPTANSLLRRFTEAGLLREITGQKRNRVYRFDEYLDLFPETQTIESNETNS